MSGMYERDRTGAGYGQYSNIERETWQQITFQSGVMVPAGQAAVIAISWGLVVGIIAGIACKIAAWPAWYALAAAGLAIAGLLAWQTGAAIGWVRNAYQAREQYRAERQHGQQADRTTVTLEWIDRRANSGYGRTVYEDLAATPEQLALVANAERLSKRGLMQVGLNDTSAMNLLSQLLAMGYIVRASGNESAQWTSKGEALRRAFTGGGGGGGGVVDVHHHQTAPVGEGA